MRARRCVVALLVAVLLLLPDGAQRLEAARDLEAPKAVHMELLVLEVRGCNFCHLVRTHIQPAYELTPHARDIRMRYIDVTLRDEMKLGLARPIDTVPTIVLMREGKEVERIAGYVGPENFLKVMAHLMRRFED